MVTLLALMGYCLFIGGCSSNKPPVIVETLNLTAASSKASTIHHGKGNTYMLEMSEKTNFFTDRQWCSIEAALKNCGLLETVAVLTRSPTLHLSDVGHMIVNAYRLSIYIAYLDDEAIASWMPTDLNKSGNDLKNWTEWYHSLKTLSAKSDLLRYALLYKFGGRYVDFDVIVRKDLREFNNTIGMQKEAFVNQAVLIFDKGSEFLKDLLSVIQDR
jgi:hypothetical protein